MALRECPECKHEISDAAPACPSCGYVQNQPPKRLAPGFLLAAIITLVLCLGTPRILLVLPVAAAVILSIVSLIRREPFRFGAVIVILLSLGLLFFRCLSGREREPKAHRSRSGTPPSPRPSPPHACGRGGYEARSDGFLQAHTHTHAGTHAGMTFPSPPKFWGRGQGEGAVPPALKVPDPPLSWEQPTSPGRSG
jgi:hypothetical protein